MRVSILICAAGGTNTESLRLDERSYGDLLTDERSYTRMFDAAFAWKGLPHLKAVYLGVCTGEYSRDFLPFLRTPGRGDQTVALKALLRYDYSTVRYKEQARLVPSK